MTAAISRLVFGEMELLEELRGSIKKEDEVEARLTELICFSTDGGNIPILQLGGSVTAVAKAIEAFFKHRRKKVVVKFDGVEVLAENYPAKDLVRILESTREIHLERRQANQTPEGTPLMRPPSNPGQGSGVPHL